MQGNQATHHFNSPSEFGKRGFTARTRCATKAHRSIHNHSYLASRFFAGFDATVSSSALGPKILIDLFFIHERGGAFAVFPIAFLLGTLVVPTVGCFIASQTDSPIMFRWTIPFLGSALVLTVTFMEETGYEREGWVEHPHPPKSPLSERIATFLPDLRVVPACTLAEAVSSTSSAARFCEVADGYTDGRF